MSQIHSFTHGTFSFLDISQLFVVRFGLSLQFFHLDFHEEAISGVKMPGLVDGLAKSLNNYYFSKYYNINSAALFSDVVLLV